MAAPEPDVPTETRPPPPPGSYLRVGVGLEFNRVSFFSDAVYAIALTLLVVALNVPRVPDGETDPAALAAALWAAEPNIVGFFIGFVLLGRYWLAHHDFFASLRSVDRGLISLNLVYLAFVAFMPFPVALISEYERNPVAFLLFGGSMAIVSLLELAMFDWAARRGHMRAPMTPSLRRYGMILSGVPVAIMLASFPVALFSTTLALGLWLLILPFSVWLHRHAPEGAGPERGESDGGALQP